MSVSRSLVAKLGPQPMLKLHVPEDKASWLKVAMQAIKNPWKIPSDFKSFHDSRNISTCFRTVDIRPAVKLLSKSSVQCSVQRIQMLTTFPSDFLSGRKPHNCFYTSPQRCVVIVLSEVAQA